MAITYSVTQLVDPREPEVAGKFYAKAQAAGIITIDDLADDISYSTTLTDGDVLNVIRALIKQIQKHLQNGCIVKLENLGSFEGGCFERRIYSGPHQSCTPSVPPGQGIEQSVAGRCLEIQEGPWAYR